MICTPGSVQLRNDRFFCICFGVAASSVTRCVVQDSGGQSANCGIELQVFEGKSAQASHELWVVQSGTVIQRHTSVVKHVFGYVVMHEVSQYLCQGVTLESYVCVCVDSIC